jgi:hypothetical protein
MHASADFITVALYGGTCGDAVATRNKKAPVRAQLVHKPGLSNGWLDVLY